MHAPPPPPGFGGFGGTTGGFGGTTGGFGGTTGGFGGTTGPLWPEDRTIVKVTTQWVLTAICSSGVAREARRT